MRRVQFVAGFFAVFMTLDSYVNDGATTRAGVRALSYAALRFNEKIDASTKPISLGS
jgi:hypothetical protein